MPFDRFASPLAGFVLAVIIVGLPGCELIKRNEETQAVVNRRAIGMPAGEFFDRFGPWRARSELADGATAYNWESPTPKAPAGVYGPDDRICRLRVVADKRGVVSAIEIQFDSPGMISTSRCGEIFKAR